MVLHPEQFDPEQFQHEFVRAKSDFGLEFAPRTVQFGRTVRPAILPSFFKYGPLFEPGPYSHRHLDRGFHFEVPHGESGLRTHIGINQDVDSGHASLEMHTQLGRQPGRAVSHNYVDIGGVLNGQGYIRPYNGPEDLEDALHHHQSEVTRLLRNKEIVAGEDEFRTSNIRLGATTEENAVRANFRSRHSGQQSRTGHFQYGSNRFIEKPDTW